MNQLAKAIRIAAEAFQDKVDKAGKPYILHCLWVMEALHTEDEELNIIAVLHDLFEDCPEWNALRLIGQGFSNRVITALILLTHKEGEPYEDYIRCLAVNEDCVKVKKADLKHNTSITRLKGLTKKDFDRMEKYHKAYVYLSKIS